MIVALIVGLAGATMGWVRAKRRGGSTADCLQYAVAHGLPTFLLGMIAMTIAGNLGWFG